MNRDTRPTWVVVVIVLGLALLVLAGALGLALLTEVTLE